MPVAQSRRSTARRFALGLTAAVALWSGVSLLAQIPGRNVNMVAGTTFPNGDPFLQRQNEPSIAASTRNPLHLVAGSNDYRTVDLPGLPGDDDPNRETQTGDAWVSVYKSFDGGQRWSSTLMPGYPQDVSNDGQASPLKGYQAAADPVVRAGTNGLVYYSGLVFDRGDNGKSAIFLARFIDENNREDADSVAYLGASLVTTSPDGATFLDKPWMAVDLPRGNGGLCVVGGNPTGARVKRNGHRGRGNGNGSPLWVDPGLRYVPAGAVYVAYSAITGEGSTLQSQIFVKRSMDCGATWSPAMRVSQVSDRINQGATLAISPQTGDLFVSWRRFATPTTPDGDAIMVARLRVNGGSFDAPGKARGLRRTGPVAEALERIFEHRKKRAQQPVTATTADQVDQGTSLYSFRSNVYPTMAIDGTGRAYIAWSERGLAAAPRQDPVSGDARIVVATTTDARTMSAPVIVDDPAGPPGHQLMPSLAIAGGKLMLVFYDQRETREPLGIRKFIADKDVTDPNFVPQKRQTIDIRASLGTLGATPSFAPSVRVSDYLMGYRREQGSSLEQLQFNPPNLPMFKLGTVPFIGDYIDVAPSPAFVPTAGGGWAYNTAPGAEMPVFHAVWTDNRDVRPPLDGNWQNYTPPTIVGQSTSLFLGDGTPALMCVPGNAGSRNQNVYTARIGGGLLVGSPGNSKQLSTALQRGFVVFAQNQTTETRTFRMQVLAQPPGGRASFKQLLPPATSQTEPPVVTLDVGVPPRSTASRTVYVTSSDPRAQVPVSVTEVDTPGVINAGLAGQVILNPDIENPDIENPDIENSEIYNPDIENPDIENPDIENPDIENPDIENPDIENLVVGNPDIENPDIENPDIENPDIENPDIENPDIENPDIENGAISDVTWTVSNTGNTTSAFNVNLFLASAGLPPPCKPTPTPDCIDTQLIIYKTYQTPVIGALVPGSTVRDFCAVGTETRNVLIANIPSPQFVRPGVPLPDQNAASPKNATLWLAPGELGRITLRIFDRDPSDNVIVTKDDNTQVSIDGRFDPRTKVTPAVSTQAVDQGPLSQDPPGATEPPIVTPNGTNMDYLWQPTNTQVGQPLGTTVLATFAPVSVRVWLNSGAPATGVNVTMSLATLDGTAIAGLSGPTVVPTDLVNGIATFPGISVAAPGTYRLLATASAAGATASGLSNAFVISAPTIPTVVTLSDWARIFNSLPQRVTVATAPAAAVVAETYNGSSTPPTAIGAYSAVVTPVAPYVGAAASVTMTVASTISAGGSGGGPYPASGALSCGPGRFATGVRVATGAGLDYALTSGRLLCSDDLHPDAFGGTTIPNTDLVCPAGVMVGIRGTTVNPYGPQPVVGSIGPRCQTAGLPADGPPPLPAGFGTPFTIDCPTGEGVTGVVGGQGAVVDSVALVCAPLPPPALPTVFTESVITGDTDILNEGVLVAANNLGAAPVAVTVNGVDFGIDQSGPTAGIWLDGSGDFSTDPFSTPLDTLLSGLRYSLSTSSSFTFGGLTPGETYRLQLLFSNDLNSTANNLAVTVQGTTWTLDGWQPNAVNLAVQFTAVSSSVVVNFAPGPAPANGEAERALLSGYALHRLSSLPPGPTITSVSPASGSSENFLVLRGTNLPEFQFAPAIATPTVIVSSGTTIVRGFFFSGPSSSTAAWIRLPGGVPVGPATVRIGLGAAVTNSFPVTVTATPSAPLITGTLNDALVPVTGFAAGSTIYVQSDGATTFGVTVRFEQGATSIEVPVPSTLSNNVIGLASQVPVPAGLNVGPVDVSIRQGAGPYSAPVVREIVPPIPF